MNDTDKQQLLLLLGSPEIAEIVELMQEAATKETCDFQLDYSQGYSLLLPHLSPMRRLARLSSLQTLAHSEWDDAEAALNIAQAGLRVGHDAGTDNLLISRLVGIASDRLVLDSLAGLSQTPNLPTERAYSVLVEMAKRNYVQDMGNAIAFESTMASQLIDKLSENPEQLLQELGDEVPPEIIPLLRDEAFIERSKRKMQEVAAQYAELSKLPSTEAREAIEALDQEVSASLSGPDAYFARLLMPSYGTTILKAQEAVAELDAVYVDVVTAIYRSQHGRDPQSIEDLESIIQEANQPPATIHP
jgi:hypothetical protein